MYLEDTIVAPATAPGRGAVAIVRLSGPQALPILNALWTPARPGPLRPRELRLGAIRDPQTGATIDRALAVAIRAPQTFTGEDVAELHCHGGVYIVRRVVAAAVDSGARIAAPGEFTRRAFLNGRIDLTEAEAIADLVDARSEGALRQALDHLAGALAARVKRLRAAVTAVRAHLEAEIDFSDEDLGLPSRERIAAEIERLRADVAELHASFARGRVVREGARAAIIGCPNAGKSSVLNLLLGVERAIVTPIPGTTRDVIEDSVTIGPWTIVLEDTAGLREGGGQVERIGIERTLSHAAAADLLITVFDASRPLDDDDRRTIALARGRAGVALLNKSDLPPALAPADLFSAGLAIPALSFSALRGEGLGALREELERALAALAGLGSGTTAAISRERHRIALAEALEALEAARSGALASMPPEIVAVDVARASSALSAITGEIATEDVLDVIFRDFCIGK